MSKLKVSVVSISYNQEKYIRQTLAGFVKQKTDFDFEIIIADDCSTDKTATIIKEYAEKYPKLFKPILRQKNIGSQPNFIDALQAAKGDYIALCEGDDYWDDANKLQQQADFLTNNPDYAMCFHPVRVFFENHEQADAIFPEMRDGSKFTITKLLKANFIQTNSVMYRRQNYKNMPQNILPLDWYLHLYHAQFGKIGFIDSVMSSYRRHPGGLWWDAYSDRIKLFQKQGLAQLGMYAELLKIFTGKKDYEKIICYNITDLLNILADIDEKTGTQLVAEGLTKYAAILKPLIAYQSHELRERETIITDQKNTLQEERRKLEEATHREAVLKNEIEEMHQSKFWKAHNVYHRNKSRVFNPKRTWGGMHKKITDTIRPEDKQ